MTAFGPSIVFLAALSTAALPVTSFATEPGSGERWEVDYGSAKCRLIRHFSVADRSYRLEVERDWTFDGYDWGLYGTSLPLYSSGTTIEIARGAQPDVGRFKASSYVARKGNEKAIRWHDAGGQLVRALRDDETVRLTGAKKLDVAVRLPKLQAAVAALETCEDSLFASWDLDAPQFRRLSAKPEPANYPGRWVTNDDYPRGDSAARNEGTTVFLLTVGADGATTGCRIVGSSGFPSLDARTCQLLLSRATFRPAKDRAGRAVASFYMNKVRWQLPR